MCMVHCAYNMWFRLLFAEVLLVFCTTSQDLLYVKPSITPAVICPGQPCLSLGQFTEMANRYFTTGSTFVFLAGNHSLQTMLSLTDVSDITLKGVGNSSSIFLEKNATIRCDNVSNLHIGGLTFILCKRQCKEDSALQLANSGPVIFSNSGFQGNAQATVRSVEAQHSNITVLNCLFQGNSGTDGGAIEVSDGSILTITGSIFTRNRARYSGGAVSAYDSTIVLEGIPENVFHYNVGTNGGGAINCVGCSLGMTGNNTFQKNDLLVGTAGLGQGLGGAVHMFDGKLYFFSGTTVFSKNEALNGGAIYVYSTKISCGSGTKVILNQNRAEFGGGIYIMLSVVETSKCGLNFVNNLAREAGGGVSISDSEVKYRVPVLTGNFRNNTAKSGSAVYILNEKTIVLRYSNITDHTENALFISYSTVTFKATTFSKNSGNFGGAIHSLNSILQLKGNNLFEGNMADNGGAMYLLQGTVCFDGVTIFKHNSAKKDGGAVYAIGAVLDLNKTVNFMSNSAQNGGAVYLKGESFITLDKTAHFNSSFNTALDYGGGVYHVDNPTPNQCSFEESTHYLRELHCFIKFKTADILSDYVMLYIERNISIESHNDSAGKDGGFLYGGLLDRCQVKYEVYRDIFSIQNIIQTMYQFLTGTKILTVTASNGVTSKPYRLCFFESHSPSKSQECTTSRNIVTHRGHTFNVPICAIAQGNSVTSTSVTAITSPTASLKILQNPQHLPRHCSNLTYNLYSTEGNEEVILYPDGPCRDSGYARVVLNLTLLPCPDGFILASDGRCECEERLRDYDVSCTVDEDIDVTKKAGSEFWIGAEYVNGSYQGLILYKTCPIEYCRTDEVNLTLHDLDTQCAHGRTGVLCGGCAENYSLLIGSSKCKECSNTYLVLILAFATTGIALVAFLSILRLTVATGMLNSLILYANIVQVNRKLLFPDNSVNILTVFIAWLNLDLGFETCFYNGMDAFAQTCLQFAFPVYVWVLISLIILTSRYSISMSKLIGHNPIAVLATLLLMSYTKVLKIIIVVYSSVKLDYPQNKTVAVWLKDANVPYLQSKHLILTVVTSLVLVFLFLPYTLLLLLGHKLYRLSGRKYFHWLNRLKPLLDSYHAPYKTHTRYWTGFLLLVRCALYIVFSYNSLGGTHKSLLAIIITFTAVGFAIGFVYQGRIYKNLGVNILEASAYLNLVTLSALSLAEIARQTALVYSLVGIVFTTMMGVIAHHIYILYVAKSAAWLKIERKISALFQNPNKTPVETNGPSIASSHDPHEIVSKTVIELREPLLEI